MHHYINLMKNIICRTIYYFGVDKVVEHGISEIEIIANNEKNIEFIFGSLIYGRFFLGSYD